MKRKYILLLFISMLITSLAPITSAQEPTVVLDTVLPERGGPLEELTITFTIINTSDEAMWSPQIRIDLSNDVDNYFTLIDDALDVDIGDREYLALNDTVTVDYLIMANANCPAKNHVLPLILRYRSGSCEGGCQQEEFKTNIALQIYRNDPMVAISVIPAEDVFPGDPIKITMQLNNYGTGPAINISISTSSEPELLAPAETIVYSNKDPPELGVTESVAAVAIIDTAGVQPGYYNVTIDVMYEDKYGDVKHRTTSTEVRVKGTAVQEAIIQAEQLKTLGINAYQIKDYTTAISYLERAIDLFYRVEKNDEATICENYIQISTTYLQAQNYNIKGDSFFDEGDYENAKKFYELASNLYEQLGNSNKFLELKNKINACNDEIYKYDIMNNAFYLAVIICILYGIVTKRKKIVMRLKSD